MSLSGETHDQFDDQLQPSGEGRLICIGTPTDELLRADRFMLVQVDSASDALDQIGNDPFSGVWISPEQLPQLGEIREICQSGVMLRDMPEGVALLDADMRVLWANRRLMKWAGREEGSQVGMSFYQLLGGPEIMGPDFCPFHTAL